VREISADAHVPVGDGSPVESEGEKRERVSGEYKVALGGSHVAEQALDKARRIQGKAKSPNIDQRLYPNSQTLSRHERVKKAHEAIKKAMGGG